MFAARFAFQSPQSTATNNRRTGTASTNASVAYTAFASPNFATTSTTQFKYGTASERLVNDSSMIQTNASQSILNVGTSDFTVEFYVWIDSLSNHSSSCDAFSQNTNFGFGCRFATGFNSGGLSSGTPNRLNIFARSQADLDYWTLPFNWPTGQWNFVAIQRKSGSFAAWVNGTLCTKFNASSSYAFDSSAGQFLVGTADGTNGLGPTSGTNYVYIDEFCVSNTYRYDSTTSNIPVPTAAFTVDSYTTQLLHMDGSNGGTTFVNATT